MDVDQTVRVFLDFYREHGHELLRGQSLLPPGGDDSVLFTTSGMHHLTPYLLGRPHPRGRRLAGVQRCLRTTDLEQVGDRSHLTVFEMLGSWSLGDYEGGRSLRWGHRLLCEGFGVRPDRLHATVWGGDEQVGPDFESLRTWRELGVPVEPTVEDNWWSNGPTGPCGPDSEIFVWTGPGEPVGTPSTDPGWVEVWNHVMMRYERLADGSLIPLPQRAIDTGMGLERLLTILQHTDSVYECDVFRPWREALPALWGLDEHNQRIVADHLRSIMVVVGDGVVPSSGGRGYVLRRLVRRVLTILWPDGGVLDDLPLGLYEHTLGHFGLLDGADAVTVEYVRRVVLEEQRRFAKTLERGRKVLSRLPGRPTGGESGHVGELDEESLRFLHETHGLPPELVRMLLGEGTDGAAGRLYPGFAAASSCSYSQPLHRRPADCHTAGRTGFFRAGKA